MAVSTCMLSIQWCVEG